MASLTWREVLEEWGPAREPGPVPDGVPGPPAEFWKAGGATLAAQNHFRVPEDDDGWSVFYVENQDVCTWAYRSDDRDDDPEVYVHDRPHSAGYVRVGARLDAFLSAAAVTEAVHGAAVWRSGDAPAADLDAMLGLPRLELAQMGWPAGVTLRYYGAPGLLAFAHCEERGAFFFVGAREKDALREVDERVPAELLVSWGPD